MIVIPPDYEWIPPWKPLNIEQRQTMTEFGELIQFLDEDEGEEVGLTLELELELEREVPPGHVLHGLEVEAIAFNEEDANEFLFLTNCDQYPIAFVHLT